MRHGRTCRQNALLQPGGYPAFSGAIVFDDRRRSPTGVKSTATSNVVGPVLHGFPGK
jgi:hypothetical protein